MPGPEDLSELMRRWTVQNLSTLQKDELIRRLQAAQRVNGKVEGCPPTAYEEYLKAQEERKKQQQEKK